MSFYWRVFTICNIWFLLYFFLLLLIILSIFAQKKLFIKKNPEIKRIQT